MNLIDDWRRSVANVDIAYSIDDNSLQEAWYRIVPGAGELMPTICPQGLFSCGTIGSFWLSSST